MEISRLMIERTGADYDKLDSEMLIALHQFNDTIHEKYGWGVQLLYNGMNSGDHKAIEHPQGKAVDFVIVGEKVEPFIVICEMIVAGFRGLGTYWNGVARSYHGDVREKFAQWQWKNKRDDKGNRIYEALFSF